MLSDSYLLTLRYSTHMTKCCYLCCRHEHLWGRWQQGCQHSAPVTWPPPLSAHSHTGPLGLGLPTLEESRDTATYKKASSNIAQYPVIRTVQSTLHFTSLTDLFTQTPSRLLWEASSHMLKLMREGCSYTYPPLSIVRYSFIQLSELEHCRVKKLAHGFNTAAQDSNAGSRSWESEALPLSLSELSFTRTIQSKNLLPDEGN